MAHEFQNVRVFKHDFIGFGPLKNMAAEKASYDWIFNIDSDESMTANLISEILSLKLTDTIIYRVKRHNYYNNKWIKACGWYPDKVLRFYHKKKTSYNDYLVHESIFVNEGMKIVDLREHLEHHPFDSIDELTSKMHHYTTLYARQYRDKKKTSLFLVCVKSLFSFIKSYFFQKGFLYGYTGLTISFYKAGCVLFKYLKLYEFNYNKEKNE